MSRPEVIVISSVQPALTTAGKIVLYRHLKSLSDWNISVVSAPKADSANWQAKLTDRLYRSRFHRLMNDLEVLGRGYAWDSNLAGKLSSTSNAIILTVAHGDGCWAAQRFAQRYRLPLVTIFHDWYPDIPQLHPVVRKFLNERFIQLYQQSDAALCVSEGIAKHLGFHANSSVLYPIPSLQKEVPLNKKEGISISKRMRVVYFGNLYDYGPQLAGLLQMTKDHASLRVEVRGAHPNWSPDFQAEMRDRGLWLNFAPRPEFNQWLQFADAFLIPMSFDPALRRRMETSFPSKLTEAVQLGKPIVIWGPEYSSAVNWAKEKHRALCVTEEQPGALVEALEKLSHSQEQLEFYAQQARVASQTCFNPLSLQQQFVDTLQNLLN